MGLKWLHHVYFDAISFVFCRYLNQLAFRLGKIVVADRRKPSNEGFTARDAVRMNGSNV